MYLFSYSFNLSINRSIYQSIDRSVDQYPSIHFICRVKIHITWLKQ